MKTRPISAIWHSFVLVFVTALLALAGCGGGSSNIPAPVQAAPPAITVSVTPPAATVMLGQTQNFTAMVGNDSQNKGVTWSLSSAGCSGNACGSLSALTSASGAPITYTAPSAPPVPTSVTLIATSVTDGSKSASAVITLAPPPTPIAVAIAPAMANVQTNATQTFTATLQNDAQNKGVTWTLSGASCTTNACGSVSPTSSASGVAVTYTAPATVPPGIVTLTATSVTDNTKSAAATITITAPPAVTVAVSPTTATLPTGGATQTFTVTLQNDQQNQGVTWTLSGIGCSGAACGTVSPASTTSGMTVTYTSAPKAAAAGMVTLTATSVADSAITAHAAITLTVPAAPTPTSAIRLGIAQVGNGYGVPVIATDASGNIDAAWVNPDGAHFVRSTDGGVHFTNDLTIPDDLGFNSQNDNLQIGVDAAGNINLLWSRVTDNSNRVVSFDFSRSADGGATFSTPAPVTQLPYPNDNVAELLVRPDGKIVITWIDATFHVLSVNSTDGLTFSNPVTVYAAPASDTEVDLATAVGPQGQIYAVWTQMVTMTDCSILFSGSPDAVTFSPSVSISAGAGSCNQTPTMTLDSAGNVNVAWDADGAALFFSRSANAGAVFSAPVSIPTSASPNSQKIAIGRDSIIYVLWETSTTVLFSHSTDSGATFSAIPTSVGLLTGSSPPSVGVDSCGNVTVLGQFIGLNGQVQTAYARSIDDGATFSPVVAISVYALNYEQQLAIDHNGNVHFIWGVDGPQEIDYARLPTTCSIH
jgi:hypothetical protein